MKHLKGICCEDKMSITAKFWLTKLVCKMTEIILERDEKVLKLFYQSRDNDSLKKKKEEKKTPKKKQKPTTKQSQSR